MVWHEPPQGQGEVPGPKRPKTPTTRGSGAMITILPLHRRRPHLWPLLVQTAAAAGTSPVKSPKPRETSTSVLAARKNQEPRPTPPLRRQTRRSPLSLLPTSSGRRAAESSGIRRPWLAWESTPAVRSSNVRTTSWSGTIPVPVIFLPDGVYQWETGR